MPTVGGILPGMSHGVRRGAAMLVRSLVILAVLACSAAQLDAQMFGPREFGRNLTPRVGPNSAFGGAGTLSGNERFLRQNRDFGDFVGLDLQEGPGEFVGLPDGSVPGRVRAAIEDLRIPPPPDVNRPRPPQPVRSSSLPYEPRLAVDFDFTRPPPADVEADLLRQLQDSPLAERLEGLQLSMEGRTAILQGTVASESDRSLAENWVRFEPGVEAVRNEVRVAGDELPLTPPQ